MKYKHGRHEVKQSEITGHVIGREHRCYQHLEGEEEVVGSQCGFLEEVDLQVLCVF